MLYLPENPQQASERLMLTIREVVEEEQIYQVDIAREGGLTQPYVSLMLSGRANPSLETLFRLLKAAGLELGVKIRERRR